MVVRLIKRTKKMIKTGENIIGGVSPLKGRRPSKKSSSTGRGKGLLITGGSQYKGGTSGSGGRKATFTKGRKQHGGFGESTSTKNKAGYRKNTKFKVPASKQFPSSGGGDNTTNPPPQKPFGWTPGGEMDFKDMINVNINNANQQNTGGTKETRKTVTTKAPDVVEYKKKIYKGHERACHEDRKAKQIAEGTFNQAAFDKECDDYIKHTEKPNYKPSNKTEKVITPGEVTTHEETTGSSTGGVGTINQRN